MNSGTSYNPFADLPASEPSSQTDNRINQAKQAATSEWNFKLPPFVITEDNELYIPSFEKSINRNSQTIAWLAANDFEIESALNELPEYIKRHHTTAPLHAEGVRSVEPKSRRMTIFVICLALVITILVGWILYHFQD